MNWVLTDNQYTLVASLTVLIEEELVEAQAAGLLADEAMHVLGAVVVYGHSILKRLDTRLQAEGHFGVSYRVSGGETHTETSWLIAHCRYRTNIQYHY